MNNNPEGPVKTGLLKKIGSLFGSKSPQPSVPMPWEPLDPSERVDPVSPPLPIAPEIPPPALAENHDDDIAADMVEDAESAPVAEKPQNKEYTEAKREYEEQTKRGINESPYFKIGTDPAKACFVVAASTQSADTVPLSDTERVPIEKNYYIVTPKGVYTVVIDYNNANRLGEVKRLFERELNFIETVRKNSYFETKLVNPTAMGVDNNGYYEKQNPYDKERKTVHISVGPGYDLYVDQNSTRMYTGDNSMHLRPPEKTDGDSFAAALDEARKLGRNRKNSRTRAKKDIFSFRRYNDWEELRAALTIPAPTNNEVTEVGTPEQPKPVSTSFTETQRKEIADRLIAVAGTQISEPVLPEDIKSELLNTAKKLKEDPESLITTIEADPEGIQGITVIDKVNQESAQHILEEGFASAKIKDVLLPFHDARFVEENGETILISSQPIETYSDGVSAVVVRHNADSDDSFGDPSYLYSLKLVPTRINQA